MKDISILILDDDRTIREELKEFFILYNYTVYISSTPTEAFNILKSEEIDIMILDINLPEMNGLEVLKKTKEEYPSIEVIMITGHDDQESIIQSLRYGAFDFFKKPFRTIELKTSIERTQKFIDLNKKYQRISNSYSYITKLLEEEIGTTIIGKSKKIKNVLELASKVAKFGDTTVLITGESGTGKELIARSIHLLSNRKNKPFFPVNCSAIPENLFESEFFGYRKGAFTGATENKLGWFEIANHGTLFLDEISDLPLSQQTKFLRVLEEKKIRKIGSNREIEVDVRIIAATNNNLENLVEAGKFRLDLFHRLNSFVIEIPPLRERKEDIPLLVEYFVKHFSKKMRKHISKIDTQIYELLSNYEFKGNIRELKNMVERACILAENHILTINEFPIKIKNRSYNNYTNSNYENLDLEYNEIKLIKKALEKAGYNKTKAAKLLNISWYALNRKIKKYKL